MKAKSMFAALLLMAFCMSAYGVQVSIPDLFADPGSTITVEISVDDAAGIAGGDILLEYDPTILQVNGNPRLTALAAGLSLAANTAVAGKVNIAMAGVSGLPAGSGAILEIDFDVEADAAGVCLLTLSDVLLFDEMGMDLDVTVVNGSVTVQETQPSQPRILSIADATGDAGAVIATTVEIDDLSDVAGADIVVLYDPLMLSAEAVTPTGLLTGLSVIVNKDVPGRIAISIAGTTGVESGTGAILNISFKAKDDAGGETDVTFESADLYDENADSILVGAMLDGTITVIPAQVQPRMLTIADAAGNAGEVIATTVEIDDVSGVAGGDIALLYDSTILSVEGVSAAALLTGMSVIVNMDTPGRIVVSIAGATGAGAGSGAILDVSLKAKENASGETQLTFESAELYNENAGAIPVVIGTGGTITVIPVPVQEKTLTVMDATGDSGATIATTVQIDDLTGVAGGDIALLYDSTILSIEGVSAAALLTGMSVIINADVAGRIVVSIASTAGAAGGSGAILNISFKAKDGLTEDVETDVTFESAELYDENAGSIPVSTVDGKIKVMSIIPAEVKTLTVADAEGNAGTTITTSIGIDNLAGVAGADIALLYDSALLSVEEVKTTDLLTGMTAIINTDVAGRIVVSIASITGAAGGSGAILNISFKAKEDLTQDTETTLTFESAELYNENAASIPAESKGGKIKIKKRGDPAVREHTHGDPILALEATYNQANVHGHTYIDIWKGSITVEAGMFLEFQVAMFSGNPTFKGTVDLHASDGTTLRDSGTKDQNDVSVHPNTDLSQYARDQWYHRRISLDALAGKTIDGVMIATDSNQHGADVFRVYVDNIQITDGEYILKYIWGDETTQETIPITGTTVATGTTFAGTEGMSDYSVTIVGATPVTPGGKLISTWGSIKKAR